MNSSRANTSRRKDPASGTWPVQPTGERGKGDINSLQPWQQYQPTAQPSNGGWGFPSWAVLFCPLNGRQWRHVMPLVLNPLDPSIDRLLPYCLSVLCSAVAVECIPIPCCAMVSARSSGRMGQTPANRPETKHYYNAFSQIGECGNREHLVGFDVVRFDWTSQVLVVACIQLIQRTRVIRRPRSL